MSILSAKTLPSGRDFSWGNSSDSNTTESRGRPSNSKTSSVLMTGCTVRGACEVKGDLVLDGFIEGDLVVDGELTISESGMVRANVRAQSVKVFGQVVGDLFCSERVELHAGAKVRGNIKTKRLLIQDGVVFDGRTEMPAHKIPDEDLELFDLQNDPNIRHEEPKKI